MIEIVIVVLIVGIVLGIAAPRVRSIADSLAVDAASREVMSLFASARLVALRDHGADVRIDSAALRLSSGARVITERHIALDHGVRVRTTVTLVKYAATGMAVGLSNGSIYITRGVAADTIVISRLGRVRR